MDGISLGRRKMSKYGWGGGGEFTEFAEIWCLLQNFRASFSKAWRPLSLIFYPLSLPFFFFLFFLRQNYILGNDCSDIKLKWSKSVLLHQCQLLKGQALVMNVWYLPILLDMYPRRKTGDNLISSAVPLAFLWPLKPYFSKNLRPSLQGRVTVDAALTRSLWPRL